MLANNSKRFGVRSKATNLRLLLVAEKGKLYCPRASFMYLCDRWQFDEFQFFFFFSFLLLSFPWCWCGLVGDGELVDFFGAGREGVIR